jgi:hypothetical protein
MSGANLDVKGESIDEERNQEESACQKEGCSEEKEVVSSAKFEFNPIGPEQSGPFLLWRAAAFAGTFKTMMPT